MKNNNNQGIISKKGKIKIGGSFTSQDNVINSNSDAENNNQGVISNEVNLESFTSINNRIEATSNSENNQTIIAENDVEVSGAVRLERNVIISNEKTCPACERETKNCQCKKESGHCEYCQSGRVDVICSCQKEEQVEKSSQSSKEQKKKSTFRLFNRKKTKQVSQNQISNLTLKKASELQTNFQVKKQLLNNLLSQLKTKLSTNPEAQLLLDDLLTSQVSLTNCQLLPNITSYQLIGLRSLVRESKNKLKNFLTESELEEVCQAQEEVIRLEVKLEYQKQISQIEILPKSNNK